MEKLVVEKLVMRVVVAEAAEREREGGKLQKRGQWELVFFKLWTRKSFRDHEIR